MSVMLCSCWLLTGIAATEGAKADAPFINTWIVCGTINNLGNRAFEADPIGEATIQPRKGKVIAKRYWGYFDDRLFSRNYDDYQDLFSFFTTILANTEIQRVAYACVYVHAAKEQPVQLRIGADNEFKAWVNGDLVSSSIESTPYRDSVAADAVLRAGWNRVLIKVGNESNGRFGFYARLCDGDGKEIEGLTYSLSAGEGELAVCNEVIGGAGDDTLPCAFRGWPYVGLDPLADPDPEMEPYLRRKPRLAAHASPYRLMAQGGEPPYQWTLAEGQLPEGLTLTPDGTITGTVAETAELGRRVLKVRVTDGSGKEALSELSVSVKERPSKWYEEARLVALMHNPESMLEATDGDLEEFAKLMKRQGYALGMMISYNNGDMKYRWPCFYEPDNPLGDLAMKFKNALEREGLRFGMYMGNLIGPNHGGDNGAILMVKDALRRYQPAAFWFDWASPDPDGYVSLDALYSMIKTISPDTLIVLNGVNTLYHGDWDVLCLEGWGAWGNKTWATWPFPVKWCKRAPLETWRMLPDPTFEYSKDVSPDWQEMLCVQLSIIGEGFVANIDHSPTIRMPYKTLYESAVMQAHKAMADWANPPGLPPLHESYTNVCPGPLPEAGWGYNTINLSRDAIYLHVMSNPRGKSGKPDGPELRVGPLETKVKGVRCMNTGAPVEFIQQGGELTLKTAGIAQDPIDTILKVELEGACPAAAGAKAALEPVPPGNLAWGRPAKLLSVDGSHSLVPSGFAFARYGVDGNPGTHAQGAYEWAWAYHVDLETAHAVKKVIIHFVTGGYATEYEVLLSGDGKEWKTAAHVADCEGGTREHQFDAIQARYVRLRAVKPDGPDQTGGQMGIAELEVYE